LLFLVVQFAATTGCAQRVRAEQFGNITFKSPAGWRRAENDGALLLVPPDLPRGQSCVLIVLPGAELRGDFRAAFDAARNALQQGERVINEGEVSAERNANGFDTLSALALTEDAAGQRTYRFYLAAHPGARIEMFVFAATNDELLKRYVPAFKEFVGSVSFANLPTRGDAPAAASGGARKPNRPAVAGAGLSGLYVATESRQQFNVNTKFYDYIVRQVYYLFAPDGRVYRGLPKGGALDDFDFDRAAETDPANLGTYRLAGNTIQFDWPGGQTAPPLAFSRGQDGLRIGSNNFFRVGSFDGQRLEGLYARGSFTNLSGGAGVASGGVGGEQRIAFSRDGRFAQRGFVGFAGTGGGTSAAASQGGQAAGTYRVSGNTLELTYADGQTARLTFFLYPREPNVLVIDGVTYLRREE
jgi:hypothetical protein